MAAGGCDPARRFARVPPADFEPRLRRTEEQLERIRNYRSYLACGGDHCVTQVDRCYSLKVGDVRFRDWIQRLAAGRNVGCPTCRG